MWPLSKARAEERSGKMETYRGYRPLTVHLYFFGDDISGPLGLLDFSRNRIKDLIERGREDAIDYDCGRNECVLSPLLTLSSPLANEENGAARLVNRQTCRVPTEKDDVK